MAQHRLVPISQDVRKCLDELKAVLKRLPDGEDKKRARIALKDLEGALSGVGSKPRAYVCPPQSDIKHS